ncbi:E3 ubiquitin-protein ligase RHF2A-like [Tasmannia lanceolata]|uniref:E3 ubiquitin-protein ligase RHF2A-like n=1 Tax=Tasmannia lanceolata TaxID=3420 RepID=UPI004063CB37
MSSNLSEVLAMDETQKVDGHLTSAAAFVEGGIQDACEDGCSICLEEFCDSDPSTVTSCKHEFHLQCVLEWCQRSSQCPMCWQSISLKDPTSQELLEAVEQERSFRFNQPRNATIFHHPALGDFELQHLPVGANDVELEEQIIQQLAAAAAMGRAHHIARREGQRSRSTAQSRPQFLVFSTHPNAPSIGPSVPGQREGENEQSTANATATPSLGLSAVGHEPSRRVTQLSPARAEQIPASTSEASGVVANRPGLSNNRNSAVPSSPVSQDRAGPSEFQSFSDSLKSRFNTVSMRYKESFSKTTKGWKERLFSRNTSVADLGSEVRREVNAGIASVSRMMERLDTEDNSGANDVSVTHSMESSSAAEPCNPTIAAANTNNIPNNSNSSASCATSSGSN